MFQSTIKPYNDLSKDQFFDILKLRIEIFVVEQCCYYQELDDEDKEAFHVFIYNDGIIVAVGRIIPDHINKEVTFHYNNVNVVGRFINISDKGNAIIEINNRQKEFSSGIVEINNTI